MFVLLVCQYAMLGDMSTFRVANLVYVNAILHIILQTLYQIIFFPEGIFFVHVTVRISIVH